MKQPTMAAAYTCLYPTLANLARIKGYALAVHGTVSRDLDVVACPWTVDACSPKELVDYIAGYFNADMEYSHWMVWCSD